MKPLREVIRHGSTIKTERVDRVLGHPSPLQKCRSEVDGDEGAFGDKGALWDARASGKERYLYVCLVRLALVKSDGKLP